MKNARSEGEVQGEARGREAERASNCLAPSRVDDRAFGQKLLARVVRISEYVSDGELEEATLALDDLAGDLWKSLAALEEAA